MAPDDKNQGEGNREAAKAYNERAHEHTRKADVEGEAVERVGRDLEELQQHLIGREVHVATPRPEEEKRGEARLQQHRADHDVGVDLRHPHDARPVEDARPVPPRRAGEGGAAQPQAEAEAAPLGDQRRHRHALDAPAQPQHEEEVEHDVDAVDPELLDEHRPRALLRDEPAGDAGGREEADEEHRVRGIEGRGFGDESGDRRTEALGHEEDGGDRPPVAGPVTVRESPHPVGGRDRPERGQSGAEHGRGSIRAVFALATAPAARAASPGASPGARAAAANVPSGGAASMAMPDTPTSRPSISSCSLTRIPTTALMIANASALVAATKTAMAATPSNWVPIEKPASRAAG